MIALKYLKVNRAKFISHIDVLRHLTRTIRRADIDISFSEGFNPHMQMKLSAPSPLGIGSHAEYLFANTNMDSDKFLEIYNKYALSDLKGIKTWNVQKNPNFQGIVCLSDYYIASEIISKSNVTEILNKDIYEISFLNKGKPVTKDVRPLIKDLIVTDKGMTMSLLLGIDTLRPDRLINAINKDYSLNLSVTDITRTAQYTNINNELMHFDQYLDNWV